MIVTQIGMHGQELTVRQAGESIVGLVMETGRDGATLWARDVEELRDVLDQWLAERGAWRQTEPAQRKKEAAA